MFDGFNPISSFMQGGMKIADYMHDEEMQEDMQQFNADSMQWSQRYNSAEAIASREWQERMSNTQYRRATGDMIAAGLNPMLAYHQGGAGTPAGATASAGMASSGVTSSASGRDPGINAANQTASQIQVNNALIDRTKAEADKIRAERDEVIARTPTHAVHIDKMRQEIGESVERIEKIRQDVLTGVATAAQLDQQTQNLKATLPQIAATVKNLEALTRFHGAMTGKTKEETAEIVQRVKANLPELQRQLADLDAQARLLDMPRREQDRAAHDRFTGSLGALIRSLTGLGSYLK